MCLGCPKRNEYLLTLARQLIYNKTMQILIPLLLLMPLLISPALAVEIAPRISDKEIVERLTRVEEGIKAIQQQIDDTNKRIDDTNKRIDDTNKRIDDLNESTHRQINDLKESTHRQINDLKESTRQQINDLKESTNKRFDILQWMLGLFITVALSIMGIIGRILWLHQKKLTQIETSLEAQKEEISFLKTLIEKLQTLIEKLLPPRGVL